VSRPGSERYTHGHHDSVLQSHRWRTVGNSAPHLAPLLRPGLRVLDAGCGPGTITADLAARVAPGLVVGVDRSAAIVGEARTRAVGSGLGAASLAVGDLYALGVADASFDVVHAHQVLQHLTDPVAALRELRRVCRPGGVVAVRDADYAGFIWAPADRWLDRWSEAYRAAARANGGEPDAGRHLLGWARAAGFSRVVPGASTWCFATAEDRAWWGRTWAERVTDSGLADQLGAQGLGPDERRAVAEAWLRWAAHPDGWFCVPSGEVLATP
jgi:SAM-dependent methyltransferase